MHASKLYYGWYIAVTLALTETVSWGIIYYAFSVFIKPMETDLGWSRSALTGAFSLALLIMGGMAFPVGWWIDRHGARGLMALGSLGATLLVIAWSQVDNLTSFYLIWAGLGVCASTVLYEPAFAVIATWFVKRRSTALALVTFAAGLASTIFIPLSDALLGAFGWRDAIFILGIGLGVVTIPLHLLILRHRPADLGYLPDGELRNPTSPILPQQPALSLSQALHTRFFWLLTLVFSLSYLAASAIRVHFIPFLIDTGMDASTAAFASGAIGLMQVGGRVLFVPLDHRLSVRVMAIGVFTLQAVAFAILLVSTSLWAIGFFIAVFGATHGAITLLRPSILAETFGTTHYGRISSVMALFLTCAATLAPVGAGWLYDTFGSYDPVVGTVILIAVLATTVMCFTRPHTVINLDTNLESSTLSAKPVTILIK